MTVGPVDPVLLTGVDADIHHLLGHPLLHVTVVDHRVGEHHHLETIVQRNQSIAVNLTKGGSKSHHEVLILMHSDNAQKKLGLDALLRYIQPEET